MIYVVVLQNCMGFVESETGYCSETCVTCDVDGTEEVSIEVEEAMDIKEEVTIEVEDPLGIKEEVSIKVADPLDIKEEVGIKVEDAMDRKEEVSIKVEEAVDIKDDIPEVMALSSLMTENEVKLRGV
jgi:hypothetical protein